jgi:hypothetical protein
MTMLNVSLFVAVSPNPGTSKSCVNVVVVPSGTLNANWLLVAGSGRVTTVDATFDHAVGCCVQFEIPRTR